MPKTSANLSRFVQVTKSQPDRTETSAHLGGFVHASLNNIMNDTRASLERPRMLRHAENVHFPVFIRLASKTRAPAFRYITGVPDKTGKLPGVPDIVPFRRPV